MLGQFAISKNRINIHFCVPCITQLCASCLSSTFDFDTETFEHKMIHEDSNLCTACEEKTCGPCKLQHFLAQHSFTNTDFNFVESDGPQF